MKIASIATCLLLMSFRVFGAEVSASGHYQQGLAYFSQADYERAQQVMERAIDLAPTNAEYRYALGIIHAARMADLSLLRVAMRMGDAKKTLSKAVELDPRHVGATMALAEFYLDVPGMMGGDRSRALALLEKLRALDAAAAAALEAKIENGAGNFQKAEACRHTGQRCTGQAEAGEALRRSRGLRQGHPIR